MDEPKRSGIESLNWAAFSGLFRSSQTQKMLALAVLVGVTTGLGSVFFRWLISAFHELFFGTIKDWFSFLGPLDVVPLPLLGGLLVGPLVYYFAREAKGHGVPEVMAAVALRGGRIRPVVVLVKSLASSICIGSGGSAGREGPIVQIGSGIGSMVGQLLGLSNHRVRNLVACGAAAGIAATFNTPIAGVIFAMEVILGEFATETFGTVVIASVVATVISRGMIGNEVAFIVPEYSLVNPWEILLYVGLGVVCAVTGTAFIKALHYAECKFDALNTPEVLKAAMGGAAVGLLGVFTPQVFGVGYESIDLALVGEMSGLLLAVLVVAKLLATSLTLGSGGSGGVFAPSLFMGAMVGGLYGQVVNFFWPAITAPSGAYALVAMGGLFSATARAPITAVIILFEMTQDYAVMLPLLFTCAVSAMLGQFLSRESIYTTKLKSRGVDLLRSKNVGVLHAVTVGQAMKPFEKLETVGPDLPIEDMARLFQRSFHHGFAIVDADQHFFGIITLSSLERAFRHKDLKGKVVRDLADTGMVTAYPDETLEDVLRVFGALDVGRIPVVDRLDHRKLVGMLRWSDIVRSHSQVMLDLEYEPGTTMIYCDIGERDPVVGRSLMEIALPENCVVNSIQRGKHIVVPRGGTVVQAGDCLHILADEDREEDVAHTLYGIPDERSDERLDEE